MQRRARTGWIGLLLTLVLLAASWAPATAATDRVFSGTVLGTNGKPIPNAVLLFCEGTSAACGSYLNLDPATGAFSVGIDSTKSYAARAYAQGGALLDPPAGTAPFQITPGADPVVRHFVLPAEGIASDRPISGTILGTNNVVLGGAFLHACPGVVWVNSCAGARIIGADPFSGGFSGSLDKSLHYRLRAGAYNGSVYGTDIVEIAPDAAGTAIATGTLTVAAGPPRSVAGTVVDLDGLPVAANTLQVWACPDGGNTGGCPGRATANVQANGSYAMTLDATETYRIWAVSLAPAMTSVRQDVLPGADALTRNFTFQQHGRMRGTVTRTGFPTPYPQGIIGVGACPTTNTTGVGEACSDLQYAFANPDGTYDFRLPPDTYRISGFMFVDGVLVIGTGQEVVIEPSSDIVDKAWSADVPDGELAGVDGNGDGVADSLQDWVATIGSPIDGSGRITVATQPGYSLVNVAPRDLTGYASVPDVTDPWGSLSFTVDLVNAGETIVVDLFFQTAVPEEAVFYKYDTTSGTWEPFAGFDWIDAHHATLTLTDGDAPGDYDGDPNGFITDPMIFDFVGDRPATIEGFGKPLRDGYKAKAGSSLPLKWRTLVGGAPSSDAGLLGDVTATACDDPSITQLISGTPVAIGDGWWQLDWKTTKADAGCWDITAALAGGDDSVTVHDVLLKR